MPLLSAGAFSCDFNGHEPPGLAAVYGTQGKFTEAEPLFKRAVAIMEKACPGAL